MSVHTSSGRYQDAVGAIREFNRFYTARLGLLQRQHLGSEFSLTEARVLYEIGFAASSTASALCERLALDSGYLSRVLSLLTRRKLIQQTRSARDRREKLLSLTAAGQRAVQHLNSQSSLHIQNLLGHLTSQQQAEFVASLAKAHSILAAAAAAPVRIARMSSPDDEALQLLEEYYEAIHVVRRDTPQKISQMLQHAGTGLWVAYLEGEAVGCVMLKALPAPPLSVECKRLYVRPAARGRHIAAQLLDTMEDFARQQGLAWIYLDSHDGLQAALALYRQRGYMPCERYNDNPQATVFLRKQLNGA